MRMSRCAGRPERTIRLTGRVEMHEMHLCAHRHTQAHYYDASAESSSSRVVDQPLGPGRESRARK
jgi:hypothetical protein